MISELDQIKKIAICFYNIDPSLQTLNKLKLNFDRLFSKCQISYFEHFSTDGATVLQGMYNVAHIKRLEETTRLYQFEFDACFSINLNNDIIKSNNDLYFNFLFCRVKLENMLDSNTLYYLSGGFEAATSTTEINFNAFYSTSRLFDIVSKFGLLYDHLPTGRKGSNINQDFYYYLKSLKIQTECVNYEIGSLFKRPA